MYQFLILSIQDLKFLDTVLLYIAISDLDYAIKMAV